MPLLWLLSLTILLLRRQSEENFHRLHHLSSHTSTCTHLPHPLFPQMSLCASSPGSSLHLACQVHLLSPNQQYCSSNSALSFLHYTFSSLLISPTYQHTKMLYVSDFKNPSLDLISPSSFHLTYLLPFAAKILKKNCQHPLSLILSLSFSLKPSPISFGPHYSSKTAW